MLDIPLRLLWHVACHPLLCQDVLPFGNIAHPKLIPLETNRFDDGTSFALESGIPILSVRGGPGLLECAIVRRESNDRPLRPNQRRPPAASRADLDL
jgi:hypothetical protein